MLAILLAVPALLTASSSLLLICMAPLAALQAAVDGDEEVAPFVMVFYLFLGVSFLLPSLFQMFAGYRVWNGRGWGLALVAALLGLSTGMCCCNLANIGCSIGSLVLLFSDSVREELRGDVFVE